MTTLAFREGCSRGQMCLNISLMILHPSSFAVSPVTLPGPWKDLTPERTCPFRGRCMDEEIH